MIGVPATGMPRITTLVSRSCNPPIPPHAVIDDREELDDALVENLGEARDGLLDRAWLILVIAFPLP
jgi:hypothetical protein